MSSVEEEDSFSSVTAIVFAVVSLILYFMFLRPTTTPSPPPRNNNNTTTTTTTTARRRTPNTPNNNNNNAQPPASWNSTDRPRSTHLSEAALELLSSCRTTPVHVATPQDKVGIGGTCVLVDGLVAFSHTPAALVVAASASLSTDASSSLRSERAKLLSRLLARLNSNSAVPPPKGSTLVVALSYNHLDHPSVSRSLYILGTWYNLLVIVGVSSTAASSAQEDKDTIVSKLNVKDQVLPKHRILLAQTVTGRVALVRQLSRVELVVDWDKEVSSQLERFGYKVALVPNGLGSVLDDE